MLLSRLENDGQPELKLNQMQLDMKVQVDRKVAEGRYVFEEVRCPICEGAEVTVVGKKDRYGLACQTNICTDCGLGYTSPRMTQASYNEFYNEEYRQLYTSLPQADDYYIYRQERRGKILYDFMRPSGVFELKDSLFVLEVGCSAGGILSYFKQQGHQIKGLDLNRTYINFGKSKGLDLEAKAFKDVQLERKPDMIIYSHVLEHVLDINAELELVKSRLAPDGYLYIEVPGIKEIHKNYRANVLRYVQNAHVFHFSLESLVNLMAKHGFELVYGDQFVKAVFRHSEVDMNAAPHNDHEAVVRYLQELESTGKYKYDAFTPRGIKKNLRAAAIDFLTVTGTKDLLKRVLRTFS